jgi:putative nucleotidyltransferase with HDIG domain
VSNNALTLETVRAAFPEGTTRVAHIAGVVKLAEQIEKAYGKFGGKLKLAALYHDIGYAEKWRVTGFHPIDGALAVRKDDLEEDIAEAVLHHTGGWREAQLTRPDLSGYYAPECRLMKAPLSRALCFCDLHIGADGQRVSLDERIADICRRHADIPGILQTMDEYADRFRLIETEWMPFLKNAKGA